jgi:predicted DNA-binding protein (UPF0251 family)
MTEEHFKFIRLIKDKKITKKEIAERMSITMPTLNARLDDPKTFKVREAEKLSEILNINILEII